MADWIAWRRVIVLAAVVAAGSGIAAAQGVRPDPSGQQTRTDHPVGDGLNGLVPAGRAVPARMLKAQNDERQKRLVEDTAKLLELATALKADVDKTDKDILSIDVVRRAEQIEKLAKSVKDRMKG